MGEKYEKLHQVISIVICNHNMLKEEIKYITEYTLKNKENRSFTEMLKLVILELPKLPEAEDGSVWRWLRTFKCKNKEEIDMLAEKYDDLKDLIVSIRNLGLIGYWREIQFHKNLRKTDERMREEYVREEAQAEGREEERIEIARNMKNEGEQIEKIIK